MHKCKQFQGLEKGGVLVSNKRGGGRGLKHRRGRLPLLFGLWIFLSVVGLVMSALYVWFPLYYWALPMIVAVVTGIFGAIRIWRYATRVHHVRSAWTRRIVMTLGLLLTGFVIVFLFLGTFFADVSLLYSNQYQQTAANAAANMLTGLTMSVVAFIAPMFFAFLIGEAHLLYRLRHHYTVSQF